MNNYFKLKHLIKAFQAGKLEYGISKDINSLNNPMDYTSTNNAQKIRFNKKIQIFNCLLS